MLTWSASPDRHALAADGFELVEFSPLQREIAAATWGAGRQRTSLVTPAAPWLARVDGAAGLGGRARKRDLRVMRRPGTL